MNAARDFFPHPLPSSAAAHQAMSGNKEAPTSNRRRAPPPPVANLPKQDLKPIVLAGNEYLRMQRVLGVRTKEWRE